MTKEELLNPRYKVIADFWNNPFEVGQIIQFENYEDYYGANGKVLGKDWSTDYIEVKRPYTIYKIGNKVSWPMRSFISFPHLFKKLEWYEEREEKDMPEYVYMFPCGVQKVKSYSGCNTIVEFYDGTEGHISFWEPATKEEYESQNKK